MITASELAGFFGAHAIRCVSDGETLIQMLAHTTADGQRQIDRFAFDELEAAVERGRQKLTTNPMDADDAVLLYDGRISVKKGKLDAIIIEMRSYGFPSAQATIAIPYTPKSSRRFLVHKPKVLQWHECDDFDLDAALDAFFHGVARHDKGAKVWNDALDESK
jgi:hypothetical protein